MNLVVVFLVSCVGFGVKAQHKTDSAIHKISSVCDSKYCALDLHYILASMSHNKSVKPCSNFEEFAFGSFIRDQATDEEEVPGVPFFNNLNAAQFKRLRIVLEEEINANDSRVTTAIKKLYAKCVDVNYLKQNVVNQMRDYLRKFGLRFYPETDQSNFVLAKYFEEQPFHAIDNLFLSELSRSEDGLLLTALHDRISHGLSKVDTSEDFGKSQSDFSEIGRKQIEFDDAQFNFVTEDSEDEGVVMTTDELNNLTSQINLNWSAIINNQLQTKLEVNETIYVENPQMIRNLTRFLASVDQKSIADFLAYDFIHSNSDLFSVQSSDRWFQCVEFFSDHMNPALNFLYSLRYSHESEVKSIKRFISEAKDFAVKKIKLEDRWGDWVIRDLICRVGSIERIIGYWKKYVKVRYLEELYANLTLDDQNFVSSILEIKNYGKKLKLEPLDTEIRKAIERTDLPNNEFKYWPADDNLLFIPFQYLHYPFFHSQRSRFFNTATVGIFFFRDVNEALRNYLSEEYNISDFDLFDDEYETAYEFYDEWLKYDGKDLQLCESTLSNRQLFWVTAAQVNFFPERNVSDEMRDSSTFDDLRKMHKFFIDKPGFRDAFHCHAKELTN